MFNFEKNQAMKATLTFEATTAEKLNMLIKIATAIGIKVFSGNKAINTYSVNMNYLLFQNLRFQKHGIAKKMIVGMNYMATNNQLCISKVILF